jgi:hypothetical protein
MRHLIILLSFTTALLIVGCGSGDDAHPHGEEGDHSHGESAQTEQQNSHDNTGESEHEETHDQEGEESGTQLGLEETYDQPRKGTRLILSYNSEASSFTGSVENTTKEVLPNVRVAVHLSNGTELGPTTPVNLDAGQSKSIELTATGEQFDQWSAHAEIGNSEHSHGEDGEHSHDH